MRRIATTGESGAQARTSPAEGGEWCRDGQQVGESRRARTKTYVTEGEPTRSPYMRPYTPSGTVTAAAATFKNPLIIRYSVLVVIVLDGGFDCFFG